MAQQVANFEEKFMENSTADTRLMPVLPIEAYTSPEWYNKEMELIFGKVWQFAGLIEDVDNPGDYITIQAGNDNILVVRGRDQRLRAFHNICRHRGTQLLRAVGKKQTAIVCPYHSWTYSLTGELVSVPDKEAQFPDLDMKQFCLHQAAVDIWRGMIFVHPNPNAEPLADYMKGVQEYLSPHHYPEKLVEAKSFRQDHIIEANWKIVAENYMDVYHLKQLHMNTLYMYDHDKASFRYVGPHYLFVEPVVDKYYRETQRYMPLKNIKGVDSTDVYVPLFFPNIGIAESPTTWSIFHIQPLAPDKCKVTTRTKIEPMSVGDQLRNAGKYLRFFGMIGKRKKNANGDPMDSGDFMLEDIYACEQQQKSLKSKRFAVGPTAKVTESQVRQYQTIVKEYMQEAFVTK